MTKIQIRRDTNINFTSKNPILAEGELAYETDTKKLKIGDGTTVYNSLAYFSTSGGTTDITASLPLVLNNGVLSLQIDGQTLQVNTEGKLSANLDELGNEVNDLSGRVTALEADVLQKQDAIATDAPLQLTEKSPLELQSDKLSYNSTTGILSYASGTQEDATARIDLSKLHIKTHEPYTLHLRAGRKQTIATGNSNFFRLQCYNDGTDTTFRGIGVRNVGGIGKAGVTNTDANALQLNSTDYVHYEFRYDGTNGISEYRGGDNVDTAFTTTLPINKFTNQAGNYSKFENEFTQLLLNCYYGYAGKFDLSQSYIEQSNVKYILKDVIAEGISTLQLNIGDGLTVTDGKLTTSNIVTTNTTQIISGRKILNTSNDKYLLQIQGDSKIKCSFGYDSASGASLIETSNDGGLEIVQPDATKSFKYNNGTNKYDILHTGNLVDNLPTATSSSKGIVKPDGTSITVSSDGTISATATGGTNAGLEGDYCSKYGIVDCPNGILVEGTNKVTLKAGVVMQMTETDGLTTNASDMVHDITSTTDFDLFYTSGSLLEATQVVFSGNEPDDGNTGVLAWYNGTKWQFKSNDTGNVWKSAPAVRLAHIHITDGNITRVDYIGNRHLNKVIPVTASGDNTFTGTNTFDKIVLPNDGFSKGIFINGQTNPSIYAYGDALNLNKISTLSCTSFYVGNTGQGGTIQMGQYPKSGNSDIDFTGYNSDETSTVKYTGLRYNADLKLFELGDTRIPIIVNGSTITDRSLKKILTQGNVTAGDNVTITNTTAGIQISATGGTSNALDVDLSNISATGKSKAGDYAFPSDTYVDLTLGASGSAHTAPANGYVYVCGVFTNGYILVCVNSTDNTNVNTSRATAKYSQCTNNASNSPIGEGYIISVNKGDTYTIWYSGVTTFEAHKFFYAKGEVV